MNIISVEGYFGMKNDSIDNAPDISTLLPKNEVRRFSQTVKLALYCGLKCLQNAEINQPDSIITGTGKGCVRNIELFLDDLYKYNETALNPTLFIQSTHNTINGLLSIKTGCSGYSVAHVNFSYSVLNVLDDAFIQFLDTQLNTILIGFFDEKTNFDDVLYELGEYMISPGSKNDDRISWGSGVCFFLLSRNPSVGVNIKCWKSFEFGDLTSMVAYIQMNIGTDEDILYFTGENNLFERKSIYTPLLIQLPEGEIIPFKNEFDEIPISTALGMYVAHQKLMKQAGKTAIIINHILDISMDIVILTY